MGRNGPVAAPSRPQRHGMGSRKQAGSAARAACSSRGAAPPQARTGTAEGAICMQVKLCLASLCTHRQERHRGVSRAPPAVIFLAAQNRGAVRRSAEETFPACDKTALFRVLTHLGVCAPGLLCIVIPRWSRDICRSVREPTLCLCRMSLS